MATDAKSSHLMKSRPAAEDRPSSSKPKIDSSAYKKKAVEGSAKVSAVDSKLKSTSTTTTSLSQTKTKKTSSQSKVVTKTVTKTREKKVFSLAGQKFDAPEEREPLRIFYESLSKQIPSSEMAEFWMMEHGLLSPDRAKKSYEKKQRKQKQLWTGTPVKPAPPLLSKASSSKPESSKRPQTMPKNGEVKAKRRIISDSDDEDEDEDDDDDDDDDDVPLSIKRRKG